VDPAARLRIIVDPAEARVTGLVRQPETGLDRLATRGTEPGNQPATARAKRAATELEERRARIGEEPKPVEEEPKPVGAEPKQAGAEPRAAIALGISPRATISPKAQRPIPPGAALRFKSAPMAKFVPSTPRVG